MLMSYNHKFEQQLASFVYWMVELGDESIVTSDYGINKINPNFTVFILEINIIFNFIIREISSL